MLCERDKAVPESTTQKTMKKKKKHETTTGNLWETKDRKMSFFV